VQGEIKQTDDRRDPWTDAILAQEDIARTKEPGSWFQFRPGYIVVDEATVEAPKTPEDREVADALRARLERAKASRDDGRHGDVAKRLGVAIYSVPGDAEALPALVTDLQAIAPGVASLDHVLVADPHRFGGSSPAAAAPKPHDIPGAKHKHDGQGLTVAILDTGLDSKVTTSVGIVGATAGNEEVLDEDGDQDLDPAAGHGTFIAGIILRYAPAAKIVAVRLLKSPAGVASELEVAHALLALPKVDVINCSFGGPAQNDSAPLVIERALAHLSPSTVVVAAAGNEGLDRPHWPAASKRVFAVGSIEGDRAHAHWRRADYSNHGWWIDASAPGTDVHSLFVEFTETGVAGLPNRTFTEGATWSGTSFATPKVAAAILKLASRDGIPVREAAYRLIEDPARTRLPSLGTLVFPTQLP
jgi:subtilisin family serine protease